MTIDVAPILDRARNPDGGFGPVSGAPSEPEPTALAAIALNDGAARDWLLENQRSDGSVAIVAGDVVRDVTALSSLVMGPGPQREQALDHIVGVYAQNAPSPNLSAHGWPWTDEAHGWVEPTAWGLLALRSFRSTARERIEDAQQLFAERECVGGGWNFGTRSVFEVDLPPYVQTTGIALIALHGLASDMTDRGLGLLRSRWRSESDGILSLAVAGAAFAAYEDPEYAPATEALGNLVASTPEIDTSAVAWAGIALGSGLQGVLAT
jgi:hypothetical protein